MKINQELRDELAQLLEPSIEVMSKPLVAYITEGLSAKRWRWDIIWRAKAQDRSQIGNWFETVYAAGANDDHIDTVLRRLVGDTIPNKD